MKETNALIIRLLAFSFMCIWNLGCSSDLPEAGILVGQGFLQKELFFEKDELERVTSITLGASFSDSLARLCVGGRAGAAFITQQGEFRSFVVFDDRVGTVVPIDVNQDGLYEFMNKGGGWQPVSLLDSQGHTLWKYGHERAHATPDHMVLAI